MKPLAPPAPDARGWLLRPMTEADLTAAHALSAALRWPHRLADWEQAFRHAEGIALEHEGRLAGTALVWRWGERHATIGLVIVEPESQGQGLGGRLMRAALEGLAGREVLLHATAEGKGLYERLGFVATGGLQQHQGIAQPAPLVALPPGWRLRPAGQADLAVLQSLDAAARGMPRPALIEELLALAEATVVLDHDDAPRGFGLLRRFGRGHAIGPVVAPDEAGAKAVVAHLSGLNAGRFTRIDVDAEGGLPAWLEGLGLPCVDIPTTMRRPAGDAPARDGRTLHALVTQAMG